MKLRWLVTHRTLTASDVLEAQNKTGESNSRCLERLKAENKPMRTLQIWVDTSTRTDPEAGYWEDVPEVLETIA
jgi:hypothetical protein